MNKNIPGSICWVPTCSAQYAPDKKYYHLPPVGTKRREIWLALATKNTKDVNLEKILFCEDHFEVIFDQDVVINNESYKLNEGRIIIPNKNMPAQVCRMCNFLISNSTLLDHKEQFFTMSSVFPSKIPAGISAELKNTVEVNPEPLLHVFTFCFKELDIPKDEVPILCSKCFYNLWLLFTFKKRAIEVEDFLGQDLTPEKYGLLTLCRTCPDQCSNFFPLGRDSEMGLVLQMLFENNYSPDVVPLRVCLNCYNVLRKICDFRKTCTNTNEIMKKRAILNEKFKLPNTPTQFPSTHANQRCKEAFFKKNEKHNMILANLMLQYGQALKEDLHTIDNWNQICIKLKEQGINYTVPSLIKNWKKLQTIMQEKVQSNTPLSDLEKLVWKFYHPIQNPVRRAELCAFREDDLTSSSVGNISSTSEVSLNRVTSTSSTTVRLTMGTADEKASNKPIDLGCSLTANQKTELFNLIMKYKNKKQQYADKSAFLDLSPELIQVLRDNGWNQNSEIIKEAWCEVAQSKLRKEDKLLSALNLKRKDETTYIDQESPPELTSEETVATEMKKTKPLTVVRTRNTKRPLLSANKKSEEKCKGPGRIFSTTIAEKMQLANALRTEFYKSTVEEKKNRGIWRILLKRVIKNHLKEYSFAKAMSLWTRMKSSAKIHEIDGRDPVDVIVREMLHKIDNNHKEKKSLKRNSPIEVSTSTISEQTKSFDEKKSISECKADKDAVDDHINSDQKKRQKRNSPDEKINTAGSSGISSTTNILSDDNLDQQKRQLFLLIKSTYKDLKEAGDIGGHVWSKILQKIYEKGDHTLPKEDAQAMWLNLRCNSTSERVRINPLFVEIQHFLRRVRNDRNQQITTIKEKKKSLSPKKRPYEEDTVYNPRKNDPPIVITIKKDSVKNDEETKKPDRCNAAWSCEENEHLVSAMSQYKPSFRSSGAWVKVQESCKSNGCNRTMPSLRYRWFYLRKKVEKKIAENEPLTDLDKKIEAVINAYHKEEQETIDNSHLITDVNVTQKETANTIKKEIVPDTTEETESEYIDLTYDYVSLEDIQQSWNITDSKPEIDNQNLDVAMKLEEDINNFKELHNSLDIEDDDSNKTMIDQAYVGAMDVLED